LILEGEKTLPQRKKKGKKRKKADGSAGRTQRARLNRPEIQLKLKNGTNISRLNPDGSPALALQFG